MRKHTLFTLGSILIFLFGCSVEEDFMKKNQTVYQQNIKTKRITYNEFNQKTQFLRNKLVIDEMISEKMQERSSEESPDYLIYTDKITEITKDGYTSYTMLLKAPTSTNNLYYNIVFEVKNETVTVFIVKYTKSENGIFDEIITTYKTNEEFPGGGANELRMYIEDFDSSGGGGSAGTPTSTTPGGMPWTGLGGSPIYPQNCDGTVTTTYVLVPHACASGNHMPGQSCEYLNPNHQLYNPSNGPYYELTPYYTCEPSSSGGNNNNPGNNNPGAGGTTPPEDEDTEITAMIQPEDCTDPDCQLTPYEMCLLNNYPEEVCECVQQNESFGECQEFIEIVEEVPEAKYERYLELLELIEDNPWALIEVDCDQIQHWQTLAQHTAPQSVLDKIDSLPSNWANNFEIQSIDNARGTQVNLDYFSINVTTLPNNPATGQQFSASQFLDYIRRDFNSFVEGSDTTFDPYCEDVSPSICQQETNLWNSDNPLGSIIYIDIPGDDGVVVCTKYTNSYWYFMTMNAPYAGNHPVSGTRQFGYTQNAGGSYSFFVRGVDRIDSGMVNLLASSEVFGGADNLWSIFQNKTKDFVNNNGGSSTIVTPVKNRPNWGKVKQVLKGQRPISDLGCN